MLDRRMREALDNYITGHYGEDQLRDEDYIETKDLRPSPAGLAAATRLTEDIFIDTYRCACFLDDIAEEARTNERKRIFNLGILELTKLFWESRKLYRKP